MKNLKKKMSKIVNKDYQKIKDNHKKKSLQRTANYLQVIKSWEKIRKKSMGM